MYIMIYNVYIYNSSTHSLGCGSWVEKVDQLILHAIRQEEPPWLQLDAFESLNISRNPVGQILSKTVYRSLQFLAVSRYAYCIVWIADACLLCNQDFEWC